MIILRRSGRSLRACSADVPRRHLRMNACAGANSDKALITLGEPRVQRGPRTVDALELGFGDGLDGLDLCLEDHRLGLELGLGRFLEFAELIAGYRIDIRGYNASRFDIIFAGRALRASLCASSAFPTSERFFPPSLTRRSAPADGLPAEPFDGRRPVKHPLKEPHAGCLFFSLGRSASLFRPLAWTPWRIARAPRRMSERERLLPTADPPPASARRATPRGRPSPSRRPTPSRAWMRDAARRRVSSSRRPCRSWARAR